MRKIIDIRNLEFNYAGKSKFFSNLSLIIIPNTINGIIGKKGEGKTTLLKLITGLQFPLNGEIEVLQFVPRKRNPKMLENIFFLPEEIPNSHLNIENFESTYAPFYPNFSSSTFFSNLNDLNIDHKIASLSDFTSGQRKKFMIAFGLSTKANLIILDEPLNGLNTNSQTQVARLIAASKSKNGSIIVTLEKSNDLVNILNNIILLNDHKILLNKTSNEILKKLHFKIGAKKELNDNLLYVEENEKGFCQILENTNEVESELDIELLFNAMKLNTDKINQVLESNKSLV